MKKTVIFLCMVLIIAQNFQLNTKPTNKDSRTTLFDTAFQNIISNKKNASSNAIHAINRLSHNPSISLDQPNIDGETILHIATTHNKTNVIATLLDLGAKNIVNSEGQTPLDISLALFKESKTYDRAAIKNNIRIILSKATPETISRSFAQATTSDQFQLFFSYLATMHNKSISDTDIDEILQQGTLSQKVALISALGTTKQNLYAQYLNKLLFTATIQGDRTAIFMLLNAGGDPSAIVGNSSALQRVAKKKENKILLEKFLDHAQHNNNVSRIFRTLNNQDTIQLFSNKLKVTNHDLAHIFEKKKSLFPILGQSKRDALLQYAIQVKNPKLVSFMVASHANKQVFIKGNATIYNQQLLTLLKLTQEELYNLYSKKINDNRAAITVLHTITNNDILKKCFSLAIKKRKSTHIRDFITYYSDKRFLPTAIRMLSRDHSNLKEITWLLENFKDQRQTMSRFLTFAIRHNKPRIVQHNLIKPRKNFAGKVQYGYQSRNFQAFYNNQRGCY